MFGKIIICTAQTAHLHRIQIQTLHNEAVHDIDFLSAIQLYIAFSTIFVNPSNSQTSVSSLARQSY